MRRAALALLLGLGTVAGTATASTDPGYYSALMGSYVKPDGARDAKQGWGGQAVFLGLPLNEYLGLEFTGFGNTLNRISGSPVDAQFGLGADLVLPLFSGPVKPFLLAGPGALYEELGTSNDRYKFSPYLNYGAGVLFKFTNHLAARVEGRYLQDFNSKSYPGINRLGDYRVNAGLQYSFYTPPPPPPPKAVAPPPPPPPPPAPPADSDKDGVPDSRDQCPNTPAGVKVDEKGCPLDSDGDGVADYLDQCPGTPKGFKVDSTGCIIEQTVILRSVNFETNKDTLTSEAKDSLDLVAAGLASQPKLTVQIDGHTDSKGSPAYNLRLSKKRAESVRTYLIGKGVDGSRLAAEGYGEKKPIASNDTEAGRAENRRVEFQVLNKPLAVKVIKKGPKKK